MDEKLLSTVLELARLGSVGIGAIVLLLAFFLLVRAGSFGAEKAKLINRFMTLGFIFGIAAGLLGLVPLFVKPGGPVELRLTFSPDMKNAGLSPPETWLPDGKKIPAEEAFSLPPSLLPQVLTVRVDKTIDEVKGLRKDKQDLADASKSLADSVGKANDQINALANQATVATAAPAAAQQVQVQSVQTDQLQTQLVNSLKVGDFAKARDYSSRLRSSVIRTDPAIKAIARDRP